MEESQRERNLNFSRTFSSFNPKFVQLPRVPGRECKGREGRECHFLRRHSLLLAFYVDIVFLELSTWTFSSFNFLR